MAKLTTIAAPPDPSVSSTAHNLMQDRLRILRAVYAGTEGLKGLGQEVLPKYVKESVSSYQRRTTMARLRRNMFRQACDRITGRIFQVPVKLVEPKGRGEELCKDFDLQGNNLDRVARTLYHEALKLGGMGLLVEYPVVAAENLAQERALNPRPYALLIDMGDILRCFVDSQGRVTHLAWETETVEWDENARTEVVTRRIHERYPGRAITWRRVVNGPPALKPKDASWQLDENRPAGNVRVPVRKGTSGDREDDILFHMFYAERQAHMVARTPLTEVADLTIEHFQVASDYRNALRQNLFPVLTATGVDQSKLGDIAFTPETVLGSTNPQAKFQMLEHRGTALESGYKDLESLEQRAEAYAGRLTKPTGDVKATTEALSSAEVSSFAKDMALSLQAMLQEVLDDFARWEETDGLGEVQINLDFAVDFADTDMQTLTSMRSTGDLSRQTLWREARRRNTLGSDFDEEEEQRLLEEEETEGMERERQALEFATQLSVDAAKQTGKAPPPKQPGA